MTDAPSSPLIEAPTCAKCGRAIRHGNGVPIYGGKNCPRCASAPHAKPDPGSGVAGRRKLQAVKWDAILAALRAGCQTAEEVARVTGYNASTVGDHLRAMHKEKPQLVRRERAGGGPVRWIAI